MPARWRHVIIAVLLVMLVAVLGGPRTSGAPRTDVLIELNEPDATFLAALAAGVFSIVDSKAAKAAGGVETADADKEDKAEQWFYTNSAGTGPYRLVRYTRETEIVLERNDRYFGAK